MNYTREPIIETVITPKEGSKLVLRCSKQTSQEDYFVDAVEIVSFGQALFYRSMEKPKPFLLPVTDYEVIELRETKMVLKSASIDKSIKIGNGKEGNKTPQTKPTHDSDRKSSKKKVRRKRSSSEANPAKKKPTKPLTEESKGGDANDETFVSSSVVRSLITPPTTLIKEKLSQYKADQNVKKDSVSQVKQVSEEKKETQESTSEKEEKTAPIKE